MSKESCLRYAEKIKDEKIDKMKQQIEEMEKELMRLQKLSAQKKEYMEELQREHEFLECMLRHEGK